MQPGKIDFVDELIWLANELKYGGDYVKDKARVGMTTDLRNAWAMKTPHPEDNVDYLNLLRNTRHQLEDVASFNRTVVRVKKTPLIMTRATIGIPPLRSRGRRQKVRALVIPNLGTQCRGLPDCQNQSMQKRIKR